MDVLSKHMADTCPECGESDFKFTAEKEVYLKGGDGKVEQHSASEGVSNVTCLTCGHVMLNTQGAISVALLDEMLEA